MQFFKEALQRILSKNHEMKGFSNISSFFLLWIVEIQTLRKHQVLKVTNSVLNAKKKNNNFFGRPFNKYITIVITGVISNWPFDKPIARGVKCF
jgi:hypothetical protein